MSACGAEREEHEWKHWENFCSLEADIFRAGNDISVHAGEV